jgi:hypothetical protein
MYLKPENLKHKPKRITEELEFYVWGVVIRIIIDPSD